MKTTTIRCEQCGNEIEISEAIKKELEEKILQDVEKKHKQEIEAIRYKTSEKAKKEAIIKVRKEYDSRITSTKEESQEREKQNVELQKQITDLIKQLRQSKDAEGKLKIEFEKKLFEEQDKIKTNAKKEVEEELNLKMSEKDKKLQDVLKINEELKRKIQQGSQQTQGEILELHLEEILKRNFPYDEIQEVPKGIKGADIIQIVRTRGGIKCGTIVWESKNTKIWSSSWIKKLTDDQRALKAELAILISVVLPENIKSFGQINNIWVSDTQSAISLAYALRQQLIEVKSIQETNKGKSTKAEIVYNYLTSNEFKQRIEVWIEYFKDRQEVLSKEKMYFTKKWEKEEKEISKVMTNTAGIYGDLQGMIGNSLPKINYLELTEDIEKNDRK